MSTRLLAQVSVDTSARSEDDCAMRVDKHIGPVGSLLSAVVLLSGCGGPGRDDLVRPLLAALSEPTVSPAQLGGLLLETLAAEDRATLEARAARLGEALGVPVRPDEVVRLDGIAPGLRLNKLESTATEGADGVVRLHFARVGQGEGDGALMVEPAVWQVIEEQGRWRLRATSLGLGLGPAGGGD